LSSRRESIEADRREQAVLWRHTHRLAANLIVQAANECRIADALEEIGLQQVVRLAGPEPLGLVGRGQLELAE